MKLIRNRVKVAKSSDLKVKRSPEYVDQRMQTNLLNGDAAKRRKMRDVVTLPVARHNMTANASIG